MSKTQAFSIWINDAVSGTGDGAAVNCADLLADRLRQQGWLVEQFDAGELARQSYHDEEEPRVGQTLGLALNRLNGNGIICLVHGHYAQPEQVRWGRQKPQRLMHLWCGGVNGGGPKVALKPEGFRMNAPELASGDGVEYMLAEASRKGWLTTIDAEEGEDDPTILPRLREQGLL